MNFLSEQYVLRVWIFIYWWRDDACFLCKGILRTLYSHNSEVSQVCKNIDLCYQLFKNNNWTLGRRASQVKNIQLTNQDKRCFMKMCDITKIMLNN